MVSWDQPYHLVFSKAANGPVWLDGEPVQNGAFAFDAVNCKGNAFLQIGPVYGNGSFSNVGFNGPNGTILQVAGGPMKGAVGCLSIAALVNGVWQCSNQPLVINDTAAPMRDTKVPNFPETDIRKMSIRMQ